MVLENLNEPIKIIISYSSEKDEKLLGSLEEQMAGLKQNKGVQIDLMPIERQLFSDFIIQSDTENKLWLADIILLLISPTYWNNGNYQSFTQQVLRYRNRHSHTSLEIIPILGKLVEKSFFETTIGKIACLPKSGKFLSGRNQSDLLVNGVIRGIHEVVEKVYTERKKRRQEEHEKQEEHKRGEKQKQEYGLKLNDFEKYIEESTLEGHSLSEQIFRFKPEGLKRDLKQEDIDTLISTVYERRGKKKQLYSQKLISYENKFYEIYKKEGLISNKNRAELYGFANSLGLTSEDIEIREERIIHQIESEKETIIQNQKVPDISSPQPDSSPKSKLPLIVALLIAFLVGFVPIPGLKSLPDAISSITTFWLPSVNPPPINPPPVKILKCYRVLNIQALNVRGEAGWSSPVIFQLSSEETSVRSFGETTSIDGETRIKVFDKRRQGWVFKEFLSRAYCGSW